MTTTRIPAQRRIRRAGIAAGIAVLATITATACSGGSGDQASADTFTWWDPYPQHDATSDWQQRVEQCGTEAGVTIDRTAYDTTALTNQTLLAAQEGNSPDIVLLDNPAVSTLADAGALASTTELGLDTSSIDPNLLDAGVVDGEAFGVPVGANTLALYYNADLLDEAGVDPETVTDWDSLTQALEAVSETGNDGITFSAIGSEEGSFQFLPWFWGAGGNLTQLDSPQAVAALELWKSWLDDGLAPNSVLSNSQNTVWEEFQTGTFGFALNGTWQVTSAEELDFETGVIQIPAQTGGAAPSPTGGEFITAPVQSDDSRYETTQAIMNCMTTPEGFVETANTFAYYIPPTQEGQETLLEEHPELETWVESARNAKGRTGDNLGTDYPLISEQLWTAVQTALSGSASPQEALSQAQTAAAEATS